MRGLKAKDLDALVDFIYYGEANIYQEDLDTFLALAEELQLKGIAPSGDQSPVKKLDDQQKPKVMKSKGDMFVKGKQELYTTTQETKPLFDFSFRDYKSLVPAAVGQVIMAVDSNIGEIDSQMKTMMERINDGEYNWKCTVCGKRTKGSPTQMKRHVEVHIEGLSYPCTQCGKVSTTRNGLNTHITVYHSK